MTFAGVIFDLDGTLIDSEPVFKAVAKRAALRFDRCFSDELFRDLIGLPSRDVEIGILNAFGQDFPVAEFRGAFGEVWQGYVAEHGIALKPGVLMFVDYLINRKIPYAIATSTPRERARESLELAGISAKFEFLIGGDEVQNGKPAPDIYLKAAAEIAIEPARCIAIEDSKVGVNAAVAAKMHTIMVPDLKPPDLETRTLAHTVVPDLAAAMQSVSDLLGT
jgi:HAD superfamily hydrolase (TIGR01509 family)